jgi:hypothetical protein
MTLEMKITCETCDKGLGQRGEAYICSYECTFCYECAEEKHGHICPNCGGELVPRPKRNTKH